MGGKDGAGKGSRYRPVDQKKWEENWKKVFGNKSKSKNKFSKRRKTNGSKKEL